MKILRILYILILLTGCRGSNDSFDAKLSKLFYGANTKDKYSNLAVYFKSVSGLKAAKDSGFTVYPPLSTLRPTESKKQREIFEFKSHPQIKSLNRGLLDVEGLGPNPDDPAVLDLYVWFDSKNEAENAFSSILGEFDRFELSEEYSTAMLKSVTKRDKNGNSSLKASLVEKDSDGLYEIIFTTIGQKF
jgi:hypothetical protein